MYTTSSNFLTKIKEGSRAFKCRVDIGGSINMCPLTYSKFWESGTHSSTTGAKIADDNRIRLKNLLPVSPSTTYYVNTNDTDPTWDIRFVFVGFDRTGAFVNYFGGISNGGTITTGATVEYLAVSMYDSAGTISNAQFQADLLNGVLKPFICLNSESDKAYVAYATSSLDETSVISFDVENQFSSDAVPSIGGVISGKLTIKFAIDGVTPSNFTTQKIRPYIGLQLDNGNYEYVPMGVFIPDAHSVTKTDKTVSVECYDILARTGEMTYVGYGVTFPTTIQNVVNDLANTFNVQTVNVSSLPNVTISKRPDNATIRSVICDIAELASANAVADRFGRVAFKFLNTTTFGVDGNNYFKFKLESDSNIKISKMVCTKDDAKNNLTVGDNTGYTLSFTNTDVKVLADLTTIFNRIYPLTYTPFSCDMQGMPHVDVGDKITITDVKNVARVVPVLYHKISFSGGVTSTMNAGTPKSTTATVAGGSGNSVTNIVKRVVTDVAVINTLIAGNITADNIKANSITADKIQAGTITAESAILANAVITDAKIDRLSANKVQITTADIKDANITTAKIGDAQITNAKIDRASINKLVVVNADIANATIEHAKIKSVNAETITTGKLSADRIDAGSITADKLIIGTPHNFVLFSDKSNSAVNPWTNIEVDTSTFHDAKSSFKVGVGITGTIKNPIPVTAGQKIYVEYWYKTDATWNGTNGGTKLRISTMDGTLITAIAPANAPVATWTKYSGKFTIATGVDKLNVTIANDATVGNVWFDDIVIARQVSNTQIEDGAITTDKIAVGAITADSAIIADATIGNAKIDRVSANKLVVVEADIQNGAIKTAKIQDGAITNAKIDRASVNKLQVTSADIVDASITNAKIDRASVNKLVVVSGDIQDASITNAKIDRASVNKLKIVDADVDNITANKIKAGTLDAGLITVTNLKADSITTGALTIDGSNLIHESEFKSTSTWNLNSSFTVDTTLLCETSNTLKISRTGLGVDTGVMVYSEWYPTSAGNAFVASTYTYSPDITLIDGSAPQIYLEFYDEAKLTRIGYSTVTSIKPTGSASWQRFLTSGIVPTGAVWVRIRVNVYRNGTLNIARPMLQRGSVASEWKAHIDEILSDGAITNDKIAKNTIDGSRIVLGSITADHIEGKTITADEIAIGAITADELDTDSVTADKIKAGEVTAEKLNVYGLKVTTTDTTPIETFVVTSDGQVKMAGDVQSINFNSSKKAGWKISSDGDAEFFNATLRGDLLLPNAGMTNAYDNSAIHGRNLILSSLTNLSGTSYLIYEATLSKNLVSGSTYTILVDGTKQATQSFGVWVNAGVNMVNGTFTQIGTSNFWYMTFTCPTITAGNETKIRLYNPPSSTSAWTLGCIALYEGDDTTLTWTPAPEDDPNPVRLWAGSDFIGRGSAPFRVYQDGSVVATVGTFNGTVSGTVDIGNIHIADTASSNASIKLNNNAETETIIKLEEESSFINTEFTIGNENTKYLYVNGATKESYIQNVPFKIQNTTNGNNVVFPNDGTSSLMEFVDNAYFVDYNTTTKALSFKVTTNGSQEDFLFTRYNPATSLDVANDVYVKVNGQVEATDQIMLGNIRIKKRSDGIDFIVV